MLILSNCMKDVADEGCLKVANSLVKRIKKVKPNTTIISYERRSSLTDTYMELNKLLLSRKLMAMVRKKKEPVLYIPFPAKSISVSLRTMLLACFCPKRIGVLLSMTGHFSKLARLFIKLSRAHIFALSQDAAAFYGEIVGKNRVTYLKTGVDTEKFTPVSSEQAEALKRKYGFEEGRKVILHAGHLKEGRNIAQLEKLDPCCQIVLVVSTLTKADQDRALRARLEKHKNIRIIDDFVPQIQELYQLADLYFFPVTDKKNCIDVPLSVLEAAACGKPVITTDLGELKVFRGKQGFYFIDSFESDALNELAEQAMREGGGKIRQVVEAYDWKQAVSKILSFQ